MTTAQLNADINQSLGIIADDEGLMTRAARYLRRQAKELAHEPTEMTEEEFFARIEDAEREIAEGKGIKMMPDETLDDFLKRVG